MIKYYINQLGENFFSCDEIENLTDISAEFYDCPNGDGNISVVLFIKHRYIKFTCHNYTAIILLWGYLSNNVTIIILFVQMRIEITVHGALRKYFLIKIRKKIAVL